MPICGSLPHRLVQLVEPVLVDGRIVVQKQDVLAARRVEAAIAGADEPAIHLAAHQPDAAAERKAGQHRLVARAVIDDDDLERHLGAGLDDRLHAIVGQVELVEDRDDDRHDRLALVLDRQQRIIRLGSNSTSLRNCGAELARLQQLGGSGVAVPRQIGVARHRRVEKPDQGADQRRQLLGAPGVLRVGNDVAEHEAHRRIEPGLVARQHQREGRQIHRRTGRPQMQHVAGIGQQGLAEGYRKAVVPVADAGLHQIGAVLIGQYRRQQLVAVEQFERDALLRVVWVPDPAADPGRAGKVDRAVQAGVDIAAVRAAAQPGSRSRHCRPTPRRAAA